MNYSIQLNAVNKEDSSVKAFATATFSNSFKVSNISVIENYEGKLFVAMPHYRSNERTEHNEAIYKDVCNPITKEFRKELYDGILELYAKMKQEDKKMLASIKQKPLKETKKEGTEAPDYSVKVTPFENADSKLRGIARIYFADSFVVSNVRIMQGKEREFIAMPSVRTGKVDQSEKPVYQDICYPITKEFRDELYRAISDCYHQEIAALSPFTENVQEKSAETGTVPRDAAAVKENEVQVPVKKGRSR